MKFEYKINLLICRHCGVLFYTLKYNRDCCGVCSFNGRDRYPTHIKQEINIISDAYLVADEIVELFEREGFTSEIKTDTNSLKRMIVEVIEKRFKI